MAPANCKHEKTGENPMKKMLKYILPMIMIISIITGCAQQTAMPTAAPTSPAAVPPTAAPTAVPPTTAPTAVPPTVAPTAAPKPVSFNYAFLDEPPGIDPTVSQGSTQSTIYAALYEGLVTQDEKGNIVPAAAKSWDVSADGLVYTFHLRDGLKWSDGKTLTANDFVYSWLRVLDPKTASTYSWFVETYLKNATDFIKGKVTGDQVGVKATDDKTLVVTLGTPAAYFLQALLTGCWLPVRQDMVAANPDKWPFDGKTAISNGPFVLTEYKIGAYITAVKNKNYWDAASVKIDNLKFSFITDANTAYSAFVKGDVDGIAGVPSSELVNLIATDDRLHAYDELRFNFLRLNTTSPGLDNKMVRRAINLAFDRKAYLSGLGLITAQPILGTVPNSLFLAGKNFREVSGNNGLAATAQIEAAQKLLTEAGFPGGKGLPVYHLHCPDTQTKNAEILQQMLLTNLGIKTDIKCVDTKLNFPMMIDGKYDIAFGGWGGDYNHPMTFLELFTSTAYDNATRWKNADYDAFIAKARLETDPAKQLDLFVQAEHLLMDESPIVPISVPSGAIMMQKKVTNWFITASDTLYISRAVITQ